MNMKIWLSIIFLTIIFNFSWHSASGQYIRRLHEINSYSSNRAAANMVVGIDEEGRKEIEDCEAGKGKIIDEFRGIHAQAQSILREYKNGKFCNQCDRTSTEIEQQEKISFEEHLDDVNGEAVYKPEVFEKKKEELNQDLDRILSRLEQTHEQCIDLINHHNDRIAEEKKRQQEEEERKKQEEEEEERKKQEEEEERKRQEEEELRRNQAEESNRVFEQSQRIRGENMANQMQLLDKYNDQRQSDNYAYENRDRSVNASRTKLERIKEQIKGSNLVNSDIEYTDRGDLDRFNSDQNSFDSSSNFDMVSDWGDESFDASIDKLKNQTIAVWDSFKQTGSNFFSDLQGHAESIAFDHADIRTGGKYSFGTIGNFYRAISNPISLKGFIEKMVSEGTSAVFDGFNGGGAEKIDSYFLKLKPGVRNKAAELCNCRTLLNY